MQSQARTIVAKIAAQPSRGAGTSRQRPQLPLLTLCTSKQAQAAPCSSRAAAGPPACTCERTAACLQREILASCRTAAIEAPGARARADGRRELAPRASGRVETCARVPQAVRNQLACVTRPLGQLLSNIARLATNRRRRPAASGRSTPTTSAQVNAALCPPAQACCPLSRLCTRAADARMRQCNQHTGHVLTRQGIEARALART